MTINLWNPHENQGKIVNSPARYKVVRCGRRFGKTTFAVYTLIEEALLADGGLFFYVAPTYAQAKMIAWNMLAKAVAELPKALVTKVNEFGLYVELGHKSRIYLKGADNPDSLRGVGLNGVVMDEYASMRDNVFEEIIRPALVDKAGWAVFIGTPKGMNHFKRLWDSIETRGDKANWDRFHFTSYDNPLLPVAELDSERVTKTEDLFAQEYMADFRKFTGLVYKDFDEDVHVVDNIKVDQSWPIYRGADFGFHNPTAWLWLAIDFDDNWHIFDEHYVTGTPSEDIARVVHQKTGAHRVVDTFGDPSAAQLMADYANFSDKKIRIDIRAAKREEGAAAIGWVESGINVVSERLKISHRTGKPRLFVDRRCANLIREFQTYAWEETRPNGSDSRMPKKVDDHAMDALRYLAVSIPSASLPSVAAPTNPHDTFARLNAVQLAQYRGEIKKRRGFR